METFLFSKPINDSMFKRGFAIPVSLQEIFSLNLRDGRLAHGEKRPIKIFLGGESFDATLTSVDFNRKKYPDHRDMWQIVYPQKSPLAKKIREVFSAGQKFFTICATDMKDVFYLQADSACDEQTLEKLLELPTLTDSQELFIEKFGLKSYRKENLAVAELLKRNYDYRCQICGLKIGHFQGAQVADCHHINYFSVSLDNTEKNLLIVCPNHHRIIHAANPIFDRGRKLFRYPNGFTEVLWLNNHL